MSVGRIHIRLKAAAEATIRRGHPWIFSDSITEQSRDGSAGELAVVFDRKNKFLAAGLYDPHSPIRVRVLQAGKPAQIDLDWWKAKLEQTLARRAGLFDASTTGGRWISGENDGWPGLVLDRYADTLVVKLYTAAWFLHLEMILDLIDARLKPERIVLRLSRNIQASSEKFRDGVVIRGTALTGSVVFVENGLRFEAEPLKGQKTGFFLDQRENRKTIGELSAGREVLNCFSFSGGFSLYAARGGSCNVADVDISQHALASAERNFRLNATDPNVARCKRTAVQADVFEWLKTAQRKFGIVVIDPPSLARRESERSAALQAYAALAREGIRLLDRNGVLMCSSCSAHVSSDEFFNTIRQAVRETKAGLVELRTTGHPLDHPVSFQEGEYLKTIYFVGREV